MKSSILLAAAGAILAAATPIIEERRFKYVDKVVETWTTKTVVVSRTRSRGIFRPVHTKPTSTSSEVSSTSTAEPEPTTPLADVLPTPAVDPTPVAPIDKPAALPVDIIKPAPAAAPAPAPPAQDFPAGDDYISTALRHHNVHRGNHSAPALSWGSSYADYAMITARKCRFDHDLSPGGGGYGQNLAAAGASRSVDAPKACAQAVSNQWYNNELNNFPSRDYGNANPDMSLFPSWGHYSQVVWVGTEQVGCATVLCPAGTVLDMESWFTVCNYRPAGNMGGRYGDNVKQPNGQPTVSG